MKSINTKPRVLSCLNVDIVFQDLEKKIKTSGNAPEMMKTAERSLLKAKEIWNPMAVFRWLEFQHAGIMSTKGFVQNSGIKLEFDFGHSAQFLKYAKYVLVSVYTAGPELEQESMKASKKGDLLEAYFLDLIGLIVLDKAGKEIKKIPEKKASEFGWGVSPFLSPGSVHGWDLTEQVKLGSLLPLEKIHVKITDNAVLTPFKTISCLIGSGPGYKNDHVGTTCQICSKKHECKMK